MASVNVAFGSWLCENAKALNRCRRNYSSKTVSGIQFASALKLKIELKNVILVAFRIFAFLHVGRQLRDLRLSQPAALDAAGRF